MSNKIILVGKDGRPSMKNVYSKMTDGSLVVRRNLPGNKYYRLYTGNNVTKKQVVKNPSFSGARIIIRWGTQEVLDGTGSSIIYNTGKALQLVSNKFESRKKMAKEGVNVPLNVTSSTHDDLVNYPVIARPYHHSKGKNFVILKTRKEFLAHYNTHSSSWYYSNFVDKVREFRVHCAHGKYFATLLGN